MTQAAKGKSDKLPTHLSPTPQSSIGQKDEGHTAPKKHRAEADARHLAVLWLMIFRGPHGRR